MESNNNASLLYNSRRHPLVSSIAVNHVKGVPTSNLCNVSTIDRCVSPVFAVVLGCVPLVTWNTRAHDGTAYAPTG